MNSLNDYLTPGLIVTHPDHPEWGAGQIQSNINGKVTVNFQHQGKVTIISREVTLLPGDEN